MVLHDFLYCEKSFIMKQYRTYNYQIFSNKEIKWSMHCVSVCSFITALDFYKWVAIFLCVSVNNPTLVSAHTSINFIQLWQQKQDLVICNICNELLCSVKHASKRQQDGNLVCDQQIMSVCAVCMNSPYW